MTTTDSTYARARPPPARGKMIHQTPAPTMTRAINPLINPMSCPVGLAIPRPVLQDALQFSGSFYEKLICCIGLKVLSFQWLSPKLVTRCVSRKSAIGCLKRERIQRPTRGIDIIKLEVIELECVTEFFICAVLRFRQKLCLCLNITRQGGRIRDDVSVLEVDLSFILNTTRRL